MKILVTGADGLLGSAVRTAAEERGHEVVAWVRPPDVTDAGAVSRGMAEAAPDTVVHCAGYTDVDGAEEPEGRRLAMTVNAGGTAIVAAAAAESGSFFVYPSTDYVFDGGKEEPYAPDDLAHPINTYGQSKMAGEQAVREAGGSWLVVRTSWLYGAGGPNFVDGILHAGRTRERVEVVDDQRGRPTWTGSLAPTLVELAEIGAKEEGVARVLHVADRGDATWFELAREAFRIAGVETELVPVPSHVWGAPALRPRYSVLDLEDTERILGREMPDWGESLRRYLTGSGGDERAAEPSGEGG